MASTVISVTSLTLTTAADSGDVAVGTIPGGCNACFVAGSYYSGTAGAPTSITGTFLSTPTAGGALRSSDASGSISIYAQAFKVSPAGSDTIRIQRGAAYNDGPVCQIVWLDVDDPEDFVRDFQVHRRPGGGGGSATITIASETTDLVVAWISRDAGDPGATDPTGTTQIGGFTQVNFCSQATFTVNAPGSPSTTVTDASVGEFWSNAFGFSVKSSSGGPDVTGALPPVNLTAPTGFAAGPFVWPTPTTVGWIRRPPSTGCEVWYSAPGRAILEDFYFGVDATGGSSATGALASITLTAPPGAATGGAAAAGAAAPVSLTAPQGAATAGAAASGSIDAVDLTAPQGNATSGAAASGAIDAIDLTAPQAAAAGGAAAAGALPVVALTAPQGAASSGATASGALAAITLAAAQGAATGGAAAAGAVDAVDLTAPQASAAGGAAASGLFDSIDLIAPQASAASAGPGAAVGAIAPVSLSPAQAAATGAAAVSGALPAVALTAPQASAGSGAIASGALASVSLTPAQAAAAGGAVAAGPMVGINLTPAQAAAIGAAWVTAELAQITLAAPQGVATEGFVPEYTPLPPGSGHTRYAASAERPARQGAAPRAPHASSTRPAR